MDKFHIGRLLGFVFVFVNIFFLNVVIHEIGHYVAADYYNLEPKIEFDFGAVGDLGFGFKGTPVASTSFNESDNSGALMAIVLTGPLFNLVLSLIFFSIFVFYRKNKYIKEIVIIGFILSFASFIMNLIPLEGGDGSLIFELLM